MPKGDMCPIHGVNWFKGGKMKSYAHPIEGEVDEEGRDAWCNQDDVRKAQPPAPAPQPSQPSQPVQASPQRADPTRQSIERQTSLKAAVEYAGQRQSGIEHDVIAVVTIAEEFYRFLSNPPVEATDPVPQDEPF